MPNYATTQPAHEVPATRTAWYVTLAAAALKLAQKVMDFLRIRTAFEERMFRRLDESQKARLKELGERIAQLEAEKTALQVQNKGQGERITALETELREARAEVERLKQK